MGKRILILGVLISLTQTFLYFILVELLQFAETKFGAENSKQITDFILPWVILIFFEIVFIQNMLCSIVNRKWFTWIMFSLSTIFLLAPFLKHFKVWPSVPFCLVIVTLLLCYVIVERHYGKILSRLHNSRLERLGR